MNVLLDLFLTFCKIGGFTFGGGYAMLPMIEKEIVETKKWATSDEVMDYYAVGQCTPGVIAVNTATFIGHKIKGIPGVIAATLGVIFPSFIIILIIASFLKNFAELEIVKHAFSGIRIAVVALILSSIIKLSKNSIKNTAGALIAIISFIAGAIIKVSPVYIIIAAGLYGLFFMHSKKEEDKK